MGKTPEQKAAATKVAITLSVLLWAGFLALFLIPTWDADIDASVRVGVALGITFAAIGATWRMVETAQADHIQTRGGKTILYFDQDSPAPSSLGSALTARHASRWDFVHDVTMVFRNEGFQTKDGLGRHDIDFVAMKGLKRIGVKCAYQAGIAASATPLEDLATAARELKLNAAVYVVPDEVRLSLSRRRLAALTPSVVHFRRLRKFLTHLAK